MDRNFLRVVHPREASLIVSEDGQEGQPLFCRRCFKSKRLLQEDPTFYDHAILAKKA